MDHIGALIALNKLLRKHGIKRIILFPILQIQIMVSIFECCKDGIQFNSVVFVSRGSLVDNLFIFTIKCFYNEIQDN